MSNPSYLIETAMNVRAESVSFQSRQLSPLSFLFLAYWALLGLAGCGDGVDEREDASGKDDSTQHPVDDTGDVDVAPTESYRNTEYGISLRFPQDWIVVEEGDVPGGGFALNIFPPDRGAEDDLPLDVHGDAGLPYVAVWPGGLGTEFPSGRSASFAESAGDRPELNFPVDPQASRLFYLKDGTPWGYHIVPASPPADWSPNGFIFAQYAVENFRATCYDGETGKEKPVRECDPLEGDRLVREGKVNAEEAGRIDALLAAITLAKDGSDEDGGDERGEREKQPIGDLIRLDRPLPNADVRSPLTVTGKARGYWFFEATFPVRLLDAKGNVLADTFATAQGEWMTEEFVPFKVQLRFNPPNDERGRLVLQRANPSGLEKNDREYAVPVIFPPGERR